DTLTFEGGTGIATSITGDTVTISSTFTDTALGTHNQTITDSTRVIDLDGNILNVISTAGTIMEISAVQQYCMDSITAGLTRYHGWLGNGSHTRIGSWTSSFLSESVFRKFEADANAVGLYTSDGTNTAHVEIDWFDDSIELLSTR